MLNVWIIISQYIIGGVVALREINALNYTADSNLTFNTN